MTTNHRYRQGVGSGAQVGAGHRRVASCRSGRFRKAVAALDAQRYEPMARIPKT